MSNLLSFIINAITSKGYRITFDDDKYANALRITVMKDNKHCRQLFNYIELENIKLLDDFLIDRIKYMIHCIEETK